ncbi:hypothetical protein PT974_11324 [Cladobotryum mycophilum]|uniref:PLC-like phosphodiesterase n=1 Tax=Cladobotryum mycophilum TaxID=491253 RepID=A0ABR0S4W6_9HYPO
MVTLRSSILFPLLAFLANGAPVGTQKRTEEASKIHASYASTNTTTVLTSCLASASSETQRAACHTSKPDQHNEEDATIKSTERDIKIKINGTNAIVQRQVPWPAFTDDDTFLTLINATPYRWKRGFIHNHQMEDWEAGWPEYIEPGQVASAHAKPCFRAFNCADSAGEVEYHFEGTKKPMSILYKMRSTRFKPAVSVQFRGELNSLNNGPNSEHKLEFLRLPSGSGFVVAGKEGDFITNDGPLNWMQAMLPELKDVPLREIILPRSHHAGLWKGKRIMLGQPANTQTHITTLHDQLGNGGIRVLDFRAALYKKGMFRESHLAKLAHNYHGMLGATLDEMIDEINAFNSEVPGELIILDVHIDAIDARNVNNSKWKKLAVKDRRLLFKKLMRLRNRMNVPDDEDISKWELNRFIGNETSAVLVNFDKSWFDEDPKEFPGGAAGFVTGANLPLTHRWSDTDNLDHMVEDQVRHFQELRKHRDNPIHIADWLLTQKGFNVIIAEPSLLSLSTDAWRELYQRLWSRSTSESYPNWIAVDNVQGNMHKSIIMAMNHCLVARKCGSLGGKVTLAEHTE